MNEDWLAEPVCWGFGSVYRVALMSGGSRRLWNQLLRSAPSLSSSLAFSIHLRTRGFGLLPAFYYLYLPFIFHFLSLSLSPFFSLSLSLSSRSFYLYLASWRMRRERFIPYRKKLYGHRITENRFLGRSAESRLGYIRTPLLSHNLRQLSPTTNSIAEIEP